MILIGMFDSPFVRRVAISASLLGIAFEHRNWSVRKDFARIADYNPLVRVPTLVLDDGEVLIDSGAILDYFDEQVGPQRALLPPSGAARRRAQQWIAMAAGAGEKGVHLMYERLFKPEDKRHEPWMERCRVQIHGGLAELERACAAVGDAPWLLGEALTQADITLACHGTYLHDVLQIDLQPYPALHARIDRCEALEVFQRYHLVPNATPPAQSNA